YWFLVQIEDLIREEQALARSTFSALDKDTLYRLKRKGFCDIRLATLLGVKEADIRARRHEWNIRPVYKRVDTCAAEFSTSTAYMYSSYDEECESNASGRDKIMVLGSGTDRVRSGIEFDY